MKKSKELKTFVTFAFVRTADIKCYIRKVSSIICFTQSSFARKTAPEKQQKQQDDTDMIGVFKKITYYLEQSINRPNKICGTNYNLHKTELV